MASQLVRLDTTKGAITLELFAEQAPLTVANFLRYVEEGFYADTIFHRVIDGFMIQGGGMDAALNQKKTHPPVNNEANNGLHNQTGTVAMARTNDPHSATAQFFINVADNAFLNHRAQTADGWGYCVFGRVTGGLDVVNAIRETPTSRKGGMSDVPAETVTIVSVGVI